MCWELLITKSLMKNYDFFGYQNMPSRIVMVLSEDLLFIMRISQLFSVNPCWTNIHLCHSDQQWDHKG